MIINQIMLWVPFLISMLVLTKGETLECGRYRATVRGRCYEEEVLVYDVPYTENLVVDLHTNVLYFIDRHSPNGMARYLDLNTKEFGAIAQVPDATAFAVDQDRHEVYVTGNGQIYKFHYNNKTAERVGPSGRYYVFSMSYKDRLYFTTGHLYTLENGEPVKVEDMNGTFALNYVIDKDGYQFFRDSGVFYGKKKGSETVDRYEGHNIYPAAVALDSSGVPYSCEFERLYFVNKDKKALETIGTVHDYCISLTFDKDNNIIYSTSDRIIKLKAIN